MFHDDRQSNFELTLIRYRSVVRLRVGTLSQCEMTKCPRKRSAERFWRTGMWSVGRRTRPSGVDLSDRGGRGRSFVVRVRVSSRLPWPWSIFCFGAGLDSPHPPGVTGKQVEPALPWPLVAPGRDHDHPRPGENGRLARADPNRVRKGRCVQNVARLRDRQIRAAINKHDF
jgi:hypothetical protein